MNSTDFAYAAGYIDGDGCFQIGNQIWGSHLVIVSVRIQPINWFMDKFDGTCRSIQPRTKNRSTSYHFRFSENGLKCLDEISKYLVEKKQECNLFKDYRNSKGQILKCPLTERMKFLKEVDGLVPSSIKEELNKVRKTIEPTKEDFAYLAGYIDAECSIDVNRRMQPKGKTFTYRPQLQCNNTKSPFFYWASSRFGGQFHFLDKSHIPNCRNQLLWRISNSQLDPILEGVYPFLTSKKPICEKMIELRKLTFKGNGRKSPNHPNFSEWYDSISKSRESIYNQIRHLNNSI